MYGSVLGNIASITYYLIFQIAGFLIISCFFRDEKPLHKLLLGSVTGSLLLTWTPILFSFFFDFTLLSHILALVLTLALTGMVVYRNRQTASTSSRHSLGTLISCLKEHSVFGVLLCIFMIFWLYLLHTHTILPEENGGLYTGQCGYGDMNMHLGFITSIAVQGTFPPDYSIMPGVKLSYPFLSDSISSTLYVLGGSLRVAFIVPMIFAMAQIFTTVYLFAQTLFESRRKSLLTLLLFFLNGGLGFIYFIDWSQQPLYTFSDIFTGFYTTPTNLVEQNIRWVNVIADMFLPQRATLFGYAALFPALWLLYRAVFKDCRQYFLLSGFFVSALPMIHTHSFLSAGIISASWLLLWLFRQTHKKENRESSLSGLLLVAFFVIMCFLQNQNKKSALPGQTLVILGISLFAAAVIYGIWLLICYIRKNGYKEILSGWGIYLICILALAVPQLLFWTFGQVAQGSFVRGHFNWGNLGDSYPWFYLKNIGIPLLLILGSLCSCNRKKAPLFLPVLFLWWLGELIVFTPNTYDNNKLLYVAYLLLCFAAADYGIEIYERLKGLPGRRLLGITFLFFSAISGILTLGREAVSNYQLYGPAHVALAEYIEQETEPDAVFLTNTRHNNEIASLTGRNIVCGADTFLYFHGIDTTERKAHLKLMFEAPLEHKDLYELYGVDYIVISSFEKNSYSIDTELFQKNFTEVFSHGDVTLYRVP